MSESQVVQTVNESQKKVRFGGIDILKIILFFMVVLLHINNRGMGGVFNLPLNNSVMFGLKLLESMSNVAVICFLLITGYVSYKKTSFNLKRVLYIYIMYVSYNLICYFIDVLAFHAPFTLHDTFFKFVPTNYYVNFYIVLMVLMPFLNKFHLLSTKTKLISLGLIGFFFVLFPTVISMYNGLTGKSFINGLSFVTLFGSIYGYTIVIFMYIYLVGGFLHVIKDKIKFYWYLLAYLVLSVLIAFISMKSECIWDYDNLIMILSATSLFMFFAELKFKSNIVVSEIANASLGVFIIHTSQLIIKDFFSLFKADQYVNEDVWKAIGFVLLSTLILGAICAAADIALRLAVRPLRKLIDKSKILNYNIIDLK